MKPQEIRDLLERYFKGECTPEEVRFIDRWYDNMQGHDEYLLPSDELERKLWKSVSGKPTRKKSSAKLVYAFAAIFILLAIFSGVYLASDFKRHDYAEKAPDTENIGSDGSSNIIRNSSNVPKIVTLEDGSIITLEPASTLIVAADFGAGERTVTLDGEAFFEIQRDTIRPFFVFSKELITRVLGTSFNIKAFENEKEVTVSVKTGKVSVYPKKASGKSVPEKIILTPNQEAVYDRNELRTSKQLVREPEIVLENPTIFRMQYDGIPVAKIFEVIEDNYGVDIEFDAEVVKDCVLTTTMTDEGLFERIDIICRAIKARYTVEDAVIKIHSNGCKQ